MAVATGSWVDLDGDGNDDPDEYMVYQSEDYDIVGKVVDGLSEFTANVTYDMTMEAEDPTGAVVNIDPPMYADIPAPNTVSFTLTLEPTPDAMASMFSDTVFEVPVTLYGDGSVILAQWDVSFTSRAGSCRDSTRASPSLDSRGPPRGYGPGSSGPNLGDCSAIGLAGSCQGTDLSPVGIVYNDGTTCSGGLAGDYVVFTVLAVQFQ